MDTNGSSEKEDKFKVKLDTSVTLTSARRKDFAAEKSVKLLPSLPLTFGPRGSGDSPATEFLEEASYEAMPEGQNLPRKPQHGGPGRSAADVGENNLLCLSFPKKMWRIVESEGFKSIRWSENGECVVIEEDLFKIEILERRGPLRIFETDSMKSFIRQLNLYGFSKIRQNQKSVSLTSPQTGKIKPNSRTKFYHNPNFRRAYPHLVQRMKRRVGIKSNVLDCDSLQFDSMAHGPKRRKTATAKDSVPLVDSGSPANGLQSPSAKEATQKPTQKKSTNDVTSRLNMSYSVPPVLAKEKNVADHALQNCTHSHSLDRSVDLSATSSAYQFLPATSAAAFEHIMGLQHLHCAYPHSASMNAQLTTLLSFFNPWFSMSLLAAASSVHLTGTAHQQLSSTSQVCPTCNCCSSEQTSSYEFMNSEESEFP
ncbi:heat shock transcription factor, Y-linked-like [Rhinatrema bivittatum]|uniref:heat shock transcription factor, Y-linked-like n=1 Tax=Rhinatrema bivittatum TaxID=194408 RepID=UPI00112BFAB5|nr:heat shock transcription factor, Y-linked-like [Rhinatrema bivittatum]